MRVRGPLALKPQGSTTGGGMILSYARWRRDYGVRRGAALNSIRPSFLGNLGSLLS